MKIQFNILKEKIKKAKAYRLFWQHYANWRCLKNKYFVKPENFIKKKYRKYYGKEIDFQNLKSYSEKVLFLKLYYHNPLMTLCADKFYVDQYVKLCGYENILKKRYAFYSRPEEIEWDALPEKFFLKCNHLSGNNIAINRINRNIDIGYINKLFKILLKRNYYYNDFEWCYKNIEPKIICEEWLEDKNGNLPVDYKFYCFEGEPKYFMVSYGEFEHHVRNHKFDMNRNSIDYLFKKEEAVEKDSIIFPDNFSEMVEIVKKLCNPFPHVRVDLYNIDGRIYFGELTFYSGGGYFHIFSKELERKISSWIKLEKYANEFVKVKEGILRNEQNEKS